MAVTALIPTKSRSRAAPKNKEANRQGKPRRAGESEPRGTAGARSRLWLCFGWAGSACFGVVMRWDVMDGTEDDCVGGGVGRLKFPVAPSGFSACSAPKANCSFQRAAIAERALLWRDVDPNPLMPPSAGCRPRYRWCAIYSSSIWPSLSI
jgi:hypothetical protein